MATDAPPAVPFALVSSAIAYDDEDDTPPAAPAAAPAAAAGSASSSPPTPRAVTFSLEPNLPPPGGEIKLTDTAAAAASSSAGTASVSFQLAQETGRQLEMRGDFTLAAEVLSRALAQEGLRINQRALSGMDLATEGAPEICRSLTVAMAHMQDDLRNLKAPLLQREPPLLRRLCDALAMRTPSEVPRPARALELLAQRWSSWLEKPAAPCEDSAFSASLDHLKASGSPTHLRAPPQQLGTLRWPRQLASPRTNDGDAPPFDPQLGAAPRRG